MIRFLFHLSLLIIPLVAANVRLTPVPPQGIGYQTHTVTKNVVHTSVLRRAGDNSESSAPALSNVADLPKRSDDLHSLHIPFQEEEGYISIYLSNTTALPFCNGVGTIIYEDSAKVFLALNAKTQNATTVVPVREDMAIEFCQGVNKGESLYDGTLASKGSIRPSKTAEISGGSGTMLVKSDADNTTKEVSVKPTKAVDEMTTPKATTSQGDGESSRTAGTASSDRLETKIAKSTDSPQATAKSAANPDAETESTTIEVEHTTEAVDSTTKSTQATAKPAASQDEERDTTTTEVVYITPAADSTSEGMPATYSVEGMEAIPESTGQPKAKANDESASSTVEPTLSPVNEIASEIKVVPTQTTFPLITTAPRSTSPITESSDPDDRADVKVAEIGHQKTRTVSHNIGAAVRARTWESKGKRRFEILGAGLWRKKRTLKDGRDKDEKPKEKEETERVPAPQRPKSTLLPSDSASDESTASKTTSTWTRTLATTTADEVLTSSASSATKPKSPAKTTSISIKDIDTLSFSLLTTTTTSCLTSISISSSPPHTDADPHAPTPIPQAAPIPPTQQSTPPPPSSHAISSAFGEIHDPRMVWTVRFMWAMAVLQVVCGVWEFVKNVTGGRERLGIDFVGRWGFWGGKVGAAAG